MGNEKRRVVITGMGVISAYGTDLNTFWDSIKNGKSGISYIKTLEHPESHNAKVAGEIHEDAYNPEEYFDPKDAKKFDKVIQYSCVAAKKAYEDSGLTKDDVDEYRLGVIVGSAAGGFHTIQQNHKMMIDRGYTKCSPFTVPMLLANMSAGKISITYGAKGINKAIVTACATSANCVGDAFRAIQWNEADVIIAGGSEAAICDIGIAGFCAMKALSKRSDDPQKASRPFDRDRDGFVMGEGAGILILEELEHAKKRGAKIYAEVVGYGQTSDAYDIVAPDPNGTSAAKAMELAVKDAGIEPKDVDYINAHGTSTHFGDIAESRAIESVFGNKNTNPVLKVSSTKSLTGHLLGAAGAVESIICVKSITDGIVPPTINLDNRDEETADLDYVPNTAKEMDVKYSMTNSFGFGGHNAAVLFRKYE